MKPANPTNFDRIAHPYRWMEYFSFGPYLQRTRVQFIRELQSCRLALVLGDGDGRFIAKLLTANPAIHIDAVDLSAVMLRLLTERAINVASAKNRLRTIHADALDFVADDQSLPDYDLVATHFFLDCLSEDDVLEVVSRLAPRLARNAFWVVSDFAIPDRQPIGLASRIVVGALYHAFRLLTGLRTQTLPDHSTALRRSGFTLCNSKFHLGGLLVSELWIRKQ